MKPLLSLTCATVFTFHFHAGTPETSSAVVPAVIVVVLLVIVITAVVIIIVLRRSVCLHVFANLSERLPFTVVYVFHGVLVVDVTPKYFCKHNILLFLFNQDLQILMNSAAVFACVVAAATTKTTATAVATPLLTWFK